MKKTTRPTIGSRIFDRGDMATEESFGTIVAEKSDDWGDWLTIRRDAGEEFTIPMDMVSDEDAGDGTTRVVTEEAYLARRAEMVR